MITDNSRYATSAVVGLPDVNGVIKATIVPPSPQETRIRYTSYSVREGDRVDNLAYATLGDATLWWQIADANPEIINWDELTPNTVIRVPYAGQ